MLRQLLIKRLLTLLFFFWRKRRIGRDLHARERKARVRLFVAEQFLGRILTEVRFPQLDETIELRLSLCKVSPAGVWERSCSQLILVIPADERCSLFARRRRQAVTNDLLKLGDPICVHRSKRRNTVPQRCKNTMVEDDITVVVDTNFLKRIAHRALVDRRRGSKRCESGFILLFG